jgi:uncharacterized oligopeptide transporter (OPT) family protein
VRSIRAYNWPTLFAAAFVVFAHVMAGKMDVGHAEWRPVGHGTVLMLLAWFVSLPVCAVALIASRGRSIWAYGALLVTLISFALEATL